MIENWSPTDVVLAREFFNSDTGRKLTESLKEEFTAFMMTNGGNSFESEALNHRALKGAYYILKALVWHTQDSTEEIPISKFFDVSLADTTRR